MQVSLGIGLSLLPKNIDTGNSTHEARCWEHRHTTHHISCRHGCMAPCLEVIRSEGVLQSFVQWKLVFVGHVDAALRDVDIWVSISLLHVNQQLPETPWYHLQPLRVCLLPNEEAVSLCCDFYPCVDTGPQALLTFTLWDAHSVVILSPSVFKGGR